MGWIEFERAVVSDWDLVGELDGEGVLDGEGSDFFLADAAVAQVELIGDLGQDGIEVEDNVFLPRA